MQQQVAAVGGCHSVLCVALVWQWFVTALGITDVRTHIVTHAYPNRTRQHLAANKTVTSANTHCTGAAQKKLPTHFSLLTATAEQRSDTQNTA